MITLPDPVPITLDVRTPRRYVLALAARQRRTLLAAAVMGILWTLCQALLPVIVGRTLDAGVIGADGSALLTGCLAIVVLGAVTATTGILRHRLSCLNWFQAALRSMQLIGHHVADQGSAITAGATTGEVVETVATDAPRVGEIFDVQARAIGSLVSYGVVAALLLRMDLLIGSWVLIGVPLLGATLGILVRPLQTRQAQHRESEGELTALGADTVAGLRVLRGIGGEQQFLDRYTEQSQRVRRAGVLVAGPQAALDGAHILLPGIFVVVLTWLSGHAAVAGRLTAGELVTIYGFAAFLRMPLETATEALSKVVRARVAARRIVAVLHRSEPAGEPVVDQPVVGDPASGLILTPGRLTALVTADPDEAVRVAERLARFGRDRVLISEAEPRLFSGPLRGEIDPYQRHSDAAVLAALEVADATDVLDALPEGLTAPVEERGRAFSGGQRQRLALARAVLADPEVLVLVEPTSAVDAHTEARVAGRLRSARAGRTTLVTTASPLLLELCDRVAFLVEGRVSAEGTHQELLRQCPGYRDVVTRGEDEE